MFDAITELDEYYIPRVEKAIFAEHGEEHFRALERQVVESLLPPNGAVIACGGGKNGAPSGGTYVAFALP